MVVRLSISRFVAQFTYLSEIIQRYLYLFNMENLNQTSPKQASFKLTFQIFKRVEFGKGVFVCGNCQPLGCWSPKSALRLEWREGDKWEGSIELSYADITHITHLTSIQFKFMVSQWCLSENSLVDWQVGRINRRINIQSLSRESNMYCAEWNMQTYIILLRTYDFEEKETYYIQGSLQALGGWREKKIMKRLQSIDGGFMNYWKNNPEFVEESFSRIFMIRFSARRDIQSFNYYYVSFGTTIEYEIYPGRNYRLGGNQPSKDRLMDLDWQGAKLIIDESTFNNMIFSRFTNQIYLTSHLHNYQQFQTIKDRNVTALFMVMGKDEDFKYSTLNLSHLCKSNNLLAQSRTIGDINSDKFVSDVNNIVEEIEKLIIKGHRVCINMSHKMIKLLPIHMLYLILFMKYSFGEALETVGNSRTSQEQCKKTRQILNFISDKLNKGRGQVKQQ